MESKVAELIKTHTHTHVYAVLGVFGVIPSLVLESATPRGVTLEVQAFLQICN